MRLRLIRHATLMVEYAGQKLLVDPMLDDAAARPPIQDSPNPHNNPLVPLPVAATELLNGVDAVLVTHTHSDHWDASGQQLIPKNLPLFCQPEDQTKIHSQGFTEIIPLKSSTPWNGIEVIRTGGQHGTGEIAKQLAPVSGFVLKAAGEPVFYVAGDTIWCREVQAALEKHQPRIIVVNAGGARFFQGDRITMAPDDVVETCRSAPQAQVVAVHMEAINHCLVTRADLAFQLEAARVLEQVAIPNDGDCVDLAKG